MKTDQRSLIFMLREHSARKRFAVAVCLVALVTVFAVFWALRISGLTLETSEEGNSGSATCTDASAGENATGTDASMEEETDGTDGTEDDPDSEITEAGTGISLASEEWESVVTGTYLASSGTGDTYYFADTTTLTTAQANQNESYIVYTMIGGDYYVVSADDTLQKCTYLGDASDGTNPYDIDELANDTADIGMYCWKDSSGNLAFKCTTLSSDDDFGDYYWTLSESDTGSTYTLYNSDNSVYIAPQDVGVSETLSGTAWWSDYERGKDYSLAADSILILTMDYTEATVNGTAVDGAFMVEVYDGTNDFYIDTGSNYDCWFTPNNGTTSDPARRSYGDAVILKESI